MYVTKPEMNFVVIIYCQNDINTVGVKSKDFYFLTVYKVSIIQKVIIYVKISKEERYNSYKSF